jgi:hypothetical protein
MPAGWSPAASRGTRSKAYDEAGKKDRLAKQRDSGISHNGKGV